MTKTKIAVIFGGISTEHSISIVSGTSVIENLDKRKYEVFPIYISKEGVWYQYTKEIEKIETLQINEEITNIEKIQNIVEYLKQMDVIFPVLHGIGGEDGTIQGLFELIKIPYVGCGVLASSVGMDKVYTKLIFEKANIKQAKYDYIRKNNTDYIYVDKEFNERKGTINEICKILERNLQYPMFVKPSNSGSSVGIKRVQNQDELKQAIVYASKFDEKILIEQGINAREIECAVLGNDEVIASALGEIKSAEEFYSFDAKYNNQESKTIIPANISEELQTTIKALAIKAFKAIDGAGLARVDFFLEEETNQIFINEINTMPGFTKISMYPKLFNELGINYSQLLDKLINLAMDKTKKGE